MKSGGRGKTEADEDDQWLVREILAAHRQGPVARRQTARARIDRKRLEVWAEQDDERMAFRPESTEPHDLPRETQKALALWTRYRLACLEITGGGRTGGA